MRIDVHIERIVVDGFLYDGGAGAFREALEAGLVRALRDADLGAIAPARDALRRIDLTLPPAARPREVGAGIADSIGRVIAPGEVR